MPALSIFESSLRRGKFDKSRQLSNGSMLDFTHIFPMDAVYDTPEDVPEDVRLTSLSCWLAGNLQACAQVLWTCLCECGLSSHSKCMLCGLGDESLCHTVLLLSSLACRLVSSRGARV